MPSPFVAVLLAALFGILVLIGVDAVAPGSGPVVALLVMGALLIGSGKMLRKKPGAGHSSAMI